MIRTTTPSHQSVRSLSDGLRNPLSLSSLFFQLGHIALVAIIDLL